MDTLLFVFAFSIHALAFIFGIAILHKFTPEFSNACLFKDGLNDVEVAYLSIVFSTLIAPVTAYHLFNLLSLAKNHDINEWSLVYWAGLGFLLTLFHIITKKLMERVRKDGMVCRFI